jgi:hypothetical protein
MLIERQLHSVKNTEWAIAGSVWIPARPARILAEGAKNDTNWIQVP